MIDFNLIITYLPQLIRGAVVSVEIAFLSCAIGFSLGTLFGIVQWKGPRWLQYVVTFYTTIIRGTPMLIQIFFAFYVLPQFGIRLFPFWTAVIAIGLNSSAYICNIIRSGLQSVAVGQIEAAQTLGLTSLQITWYIVLPQAIRIVIPALGNELITLVKDSSLASLIGVVELSKEASHIRGVTLDALSVYPAVAILYLIITTTLSVCVNYIEKRMNYHAQH